MDYKKELTGYLEEAIDTAMSDHAIENQTYKQDILVDVEKEFANLSPEDIQVYYEAVRDIEEQTGETGVSDVKVLRSGKTYIKITKSDLFNIITDIIAIATTPGLTFKSIFMAKLINDVFACWIRGEKKVLFVLDILAKGCNNATEPLRDTSISKELHTQKEFIITIQELLNEINRVYKMNFEELKGIINELNSRWNLFICGISPDSEQGTLTIKINPS